MYRFRIDKTKKEAAKLSITTSAFVG